MFTTLISTDDLAAHLDDSGWVAIDCRFDLQDPKAGERLYASSHVAGAVYADLDRDLSGTRTGTNGRHPLPSVDALRQRFGTWGIGPDTQVVANDERNGMFASRLWWLLRFLGHQAVAVLDGGFARWQAESRPTNGALEHRVPVTFAGNPDLTRLVALEDVERLRHDPSHRLVDARAPERYRGDTEPLDPVAGHIPGAVNHFFQENLNADGTFLPARTLHTRLQARLGGTSSDRVISYCGSGVTACHNLLALEHAGLEGARLYPGSWSEWCADPTRPAALGQDT